VKAAPTGTGHTVLTALNAGAITSIGSLYKVSPLETNTTPLLIGTIPDQPSEPVAWTHTYGPNKAKIFYTSLGHPDDFQNPEFRRLLCNAIGWALKP
jgi:type 1 glutamine amidotransferase